MCGILGYLGKNLPGEEKIKQARELLAHRGPDNKGLYYDAKEGIALAHRRLSIIDLSSAGHQPFFSNDKRYVLVYNGEIYNYLELRDELKNSYDFKTKTDTEVSLAAYIKYGEKCLDKFNGMFAFAIYDKLEKRLFCARDRLGIKPFYYYCDDDKFIFASEIKAILGLIGKQEVNDKMVFDYLYYGFYDHTNETFFKNIKKLEAGHYAISQNANWRIEKYWDLDKVNYDFTSMSESEVKNKFEELLADSIKLRFRSDVPVGINLSSGLDSNALRYYTNKFIGGDVDMLTMRAESEEYDEGKILEKFLSEEEKKHWRRCYIKPEESLIKRAEEMQKIQDQPYGGIPTIVYRELIKLAKENNITVLLEGQGMDELLAGYKYYNNPQNLQFSQDMSRLTDADVLSKDFVQQYKDKELKFRAPFQDDLLNAQYRDIKYTKLPRVLRFNDHITMHYGRELRLPFLDYRIVEFCFHLPREYKIRDGEQKFLMRDLMKDKLSGIGERPKKAFGAMQTEWFRNNYKNELLSLINSESFKSRVYWDHKKLNKKVNDFFAGDGDNSFFIWQCVNLEIFLKNMEEEKVKTKKIGEYSTKELFKICRVSILHKKKDDTKIGTFSTHIAIYFSRLFLYTKITPNQITAISTIVFFIGISFLLIGDYVANITAALYIFFSIILDGCDGDVARFRRRGMTNTDTGMAGKVGVMYVEPVSHDVQYGLAPLIIAHALVINGFPPYYYILGAMAGITKLLFRLLQERLCQIFATDNVSSAQSEEMHNNLKKKSIFIKIMYRLNKNFFSNVGVFTVIFICAIINRIDLALWIFGVGYTFFWLALFGKQIYQISKM